MVDTSTAFDEEVMIALLPTSSEWSDLDLPHLTLVYAGLKKDLKPNAFSELAKDVAMLASLTRPVGLRVMRRDTFGEAKDHDVFRLQPSTELWAMRRAVERWNASEFDFSPHVTIGPAGSIVDITPVYIRFDRIALSWGDELLSFWLRR